MSCTDFEKSDLGSYISLNSSFAAKECKMVNRPVYATRYSKNTWVFPTEKILHQADTNLKLSHQLIYVAWHYCTHLKEIAYIVIWSYESSNWIR